MSASLRKSCFGVLHICVKWCLMIIALTMSSHSETVYVLILVRILAFVYTFTFISLIRKIINFFCQVKPDFILPNRSIGPSESLWLFYLQDLLLCYL